MSSGFPPRTAVAPTEESWAEKEAASEVSGQNLPVDAQRLDVWNFAGNHWHQTALWTINSGPNEKSLKPS